MKTHRDILSRWPSLSALSRQLSAQGDEITAMGVVRWAQRDSIPAEWFEAVVKAAGAAGYDEITLELIASTAAKRRTEAAE